MNWRVGIGYDVHQLAAGYKLIIGGIEIPFDKGSVAHSDGDVLVHAICDALLGAAALGDIGLHFPDSDQSFKGIDSKILLYESIRLIRESGYEVGNIDSTICLQQPRIAGYIEEMKKVLSGVMEVSPDKVSIKATTTERMGFVGRGEGVTAYAVAMIYKAT